MNEYTPPIFGNMCYKHKQKLGLHKKGSIQYYPFLESKFFKFYKSSKISPSAIGKFA